MKLKCASVTAAVLMGASLGLAEESDKLRHAQEWLQDAVENFRNAKEEYEDGKLELLQRKLEWKLDMAEDPEDRPPPQAWDLREQLQKVFEKRLQKRLEQADCRVKLAQARLHFVQLRESVEGLYAISGRLQNTRFGEQAEGLRGLAKKIEGQLREARLRRHYYEAKLDGDEGKAKAIAGQMKDKPPPPIKLKAPEVF